jgi:hypothetical protein
MTCISKLDLKLLQSGKSIGVMGALTPEGLEVQDTIFCFDSPYLRHENFSYRLVTATYSYRIHKYCTQSNANIQVAIQDQISIFYINPELSGTQCWEWLEEREMDGERGEYSNIHQKAAQMEGSHSY